MARADRDKEEETIMGGTYLDPTGKNVVESLEYTPVIGPTRHAKPFRGKANLQGYGLIDIDSTPDLIIGNWGKEVGWYYTGTYDGVAYYNRVEVVKVIDGKVAP